MTNEADKREQDQRFQNYVYQRDTMWSLLVAALDKNPMYFDYEIFKLVVFDNIEFCWVHQRVCHTVFYHTSDGVVVQSYVCKLCEESRGGEWTSFKSIARQGLLGNPYGPRYKRRVRVVEAGWSSRRAF